MKKLFTVIRQGKLDEVTRILDKNPDLISCLATAPPKKDNGQSPLMVAIKSDNVAVEEQLQRYEIKWRELEPVLRSYYEKTL